jgi:DNA-binding GntR family transcriptional regulator
MPNKNGSRTSGTANLIYDCIWAGIVERRLPAGTRLPEETLANVFGVGRGHVRAALGRLAHDHVVTHIPNRGVVVAQPTPWEARQILAARRVVEEGIMRVLVPRIRKDDIDSLRRHVEAELDAAQRGDRIEAIRLSGEFHMTLARIAGNEILERFLRDLIAKSSLIVSIYERPDQPECSHDEHSAVLDHIEHRDVDRAAVAMARHLDEIEARLSLSEKTPKRVDLKKLLGTLAE